METSNSDRHDDRLGHSVYGGRMTSLGTEGSMGVIHRNDSSLTKYRSERSWVGKSRRQA
jgi:hypothetical protein